jgi:hypothetical protein
MIPSQFASYWVYRTSTWRQARPIRVCQCAVETCSAIRSSEAGVGGLHNYDAEVKAGPGMKDRVVLTVL